jgi:capsule polysaccharide export protein KpsC/LpsZ
LKWRGEEAVGVDCEEEKVAQHEIPVAWIVNGFLPSVKFGETLMNFHEIS